MSYRLLYHGFGVRGYKLEKTGYKKGAMTFTISQPRSSYRCPECGSADVIGRGHSRRRYRTLPIGNKPVWLVLAVPRVECRECGVVRQVKVAFADERVSYTRAFERYALELSKYMTIKDVVSRLGISWDAIKDIQKRNLRRRFGKPKLKHLKQIAIDEISTGKGHRYITIVMDLKSGAVVHVGDGKGGDALTAFWRRLRASHAKIEAVATDMSPAYIVAVIDHLPNAIWQRWPVCWWVLNVVDHFSRRSMGFAVFKSKPSSEEVTAALDRIILKECVRPKHIIVDQGSEFKCEHFEEKWCKAMNILPRFGAVGRHGSVAVVERFHRTIKDILQLITVPEDQPQFEREVSLIINWHTEHRPHEM